MRSSRPGTRNGQVAAVEVLPIAPVERVSISPAMAGSFMVSDPLKASIPKRSMPKQPIASRRKRRVVSPALHRDPLETVFVPWGGNVGWAQPTIHPEPRIGKVHSDCMHCFCVFAKRMKKHKRGAAPVMIEHRLSPLQSRCLFRLTKKASLPGSDEKDHGRDAGFSFPNAPSLRRRGAGLRSRIQPRFERRFGSGLKCL